jgi:ferredoxin
VVEVLKIEIDKSLCSGFGSCIELAPEAFVLGDTGHAETLPGADRGLKGVIDAVRSCPMGALAVIDDETGEQLA